MNKDFLLTVQESDSDINKQTTTSEEHAQKIT